MMCNGQVCPWHSTSPANIMAAVLVQHFSQLLSHEDEALMYLPVYSSASLTVNTATGHSAILLTQQCSHLSLIHI